MVQRITDPSFKKALHAHVSTDVAKVGFFASAKYPDGTPVAYVAAINEFGYPQGNIPSRSFIRSTIEEKKPEWSKQMASMAKRIVRGKMSTHDALDAIGSLASGQMRETIAAYSEIPLAPSTLSARKRRGNSSTKPLVDTRVMNNSLTYTVEQE